MPNGGKIDFGTLEISEQANNYLSIKSSYGNSYMGMGNATYCHMNTDAVSGHYFYKGIRAVGVISGADATATSDINLKNNIKTIKNASKKRRAIRGTTNNRIDMGNMYHASPIAQEIEKVFPVAIITSKYDGIDKHGNKMKTKKEVLQSPINALLIESANEDYDHFTNEISSLKKQVEELNKIIKGMVK